MKKISLGVLALLLAGCGIFEPIPESYKNRLAETPEPVIAKDPVITEEQEDVFTATPIAEPVGPGAEIVTTDMVKYVNTVTGETSYGPSYGGYLANHSDWEQVLGESM